MVVGHSLRRVRAWGPRRTLLWYWDRRYQPARRERDERPMTDRHRPPAKRTVAAARRARARDRRVYLASHPIIFALLAATRGRSITRLGGTVLVQGTDAFRQVLTRLPLDRTAEQTTGGLAREFIPDGVLFDQEGQAHRDTRRSLAPDLSTTGVDRLRPVWRAVLTRRFAPLADGECVDLTEVAAEVAGATVCALLGLDTDPLLIAQLTADAAAAAARAHLPGLPRPGSARALTVATNRLISALGAAYRPLPAAAAHPASPGHPATGAPHPSRPWPPRRRGGPGRDARDRGGEHHRRRTPPRGGLVRRLRAVARCGQRRPARGAGQRVAQGHRADRVAAEGGRCGAGR